MSIAATFADKMTFRTELGKEPFLVAKEQEELLKKKADMYYRDLEKVYHRGLAIQQLVSNLGRLFEIITYLPNAPIAPGVTGFGLPKEELIRTVHLAGGDDLPAKEYKILGELLKSAVAGNVFLVKQIKQGQRGTEKIVFYFNRLLCIRFLRDKV